MPRLPPEWHAHIEGGVSHRVGSCDRDGQPALCRALAAEVLDDGRLRVLLDRAAGREVVQAVEQTARVAVVMGMPTTHRTLHVVGRDAVVAPASPSLRPLLVARSEAFVRQIEGFGFARETVLRHWFRVPDEDLVSLTFTLGGAWDQTPGPGAGQPVELL